MNYDEFKKAEVEGWHSRAENYDDVTGLITTQAIPLLLHLVQTAPRRRVLDVCCGTGRAVGAAIALGAQAEGVDAAPGMIAVARARLPGAVFEIGDAEAIPRESGAYDGVVCSFGLMHVGSPDALLGEIARVLKPGGRAALSHWVGPPASALFRIVFGAMQRHADLSAAPPAPPPFALSSEQTLRAALEAKGFEDIAVHPLPLVFTCPAGRFVQHFRAFAARASVILDAQTEPVLQRIYADWESQLEAFVVDGDHRIPMPALAVSGAAPR